MLGLRLEFAAKRTSDSLSKQLPIHNVGTHVAHEHTPDVFQMPISGQCHIVSKHDPLGEMIRRDESGVRDEIIHMERFAVLDAAAVAQSHADLVQKSGVSRLCLGFVGRGRWYSRLAAGC